MKRRTKRPILRLVPRPAELDDDCPDWISTKDALDYIGQDLREAMERLWAIRVQGLTPHNLFLLRDSLDTAFFAVQQIKIADLRVAEGDAR